MTTEAQRRRHARESLIARIVGAAVVSMTEASDLGDAGFVQAIDEAINELREIVEAKRREIYG